MNTCLVTTTYFPLTNEVEHARAAAAVRGAEVLHSIGIDCIIVDAGSSKKFIDAVAKFNPTIIKQAGETLGSARRQAIQAAQEQGFSNLVYSELEKDTFLPHIPQLTTELFNSKCDIIIPRRASLLSYPFFQRRSEELLNSFFNKLCDVNFDIAFGPRVWRREASHFFLQYHGELGDRWDAHFIPIVRAVHAKSAIGSIVVPYENPPQQTMAENDNLEIMRKRIDQLYSITNGMLTEWCSLEEDLNSSVENAVGNM